MDRNNGRKSESCFYIYVDKLEEAMANLLYGWR